MQKFPCLHRHTATRSITASKLTVELKTDDTAFKNQPKKEDLAFGQTISDHMLMVPWSVENQWGDPKIVPYEDLKISPAASCLHYGLQCFEGMKAYKALDDPNSLHLFRPHKNMERLTGSMERLSMPGADFDNGELVKLIEELVKVDQKWIPRGEGYSLYIRPTVIATHRFLGMAPPIDLLLFVITSPVGPYYKTGFKPIRLTCDTPFVRAWPGGTGNSKVGGNYGPTMKAQADAAARRYSQVLWLFGDKEVVTEVGAMNVFFLIQNKETNLPELITPPLTSGDILPGVTRDSIIALAETWDDLTVVEWAPTIHEIKEAAEEGRLLEAFGAGTAAVVTPIDCIEYKGQDINVPADGKLTQRIWDAVTGIQYGRREGPEGWCHKIQ
ncbi:Branched-chain amino acid aminotransferase [Seminavis robusta]|uniref:Branched-chain-amino-acid aminotransferase n=1 Tax=Seminavis robusta TaxID=568900 RepID=A0A9N8HXH8_9STRA|nr:Branched-chain amino acid aminotransferase [Seminavis robusta]|eukprot:Sro2216_g319460.1 Branched-chain amino acid aminotransferase (385) ;mRNA; r:11131-12497